MEGIPKFNIHQFEDRLHINWEEIGEILDCVWITDVWLKYNKD